MIKLMQKISATCLCLIISILLMDYYFTILSFNTIFTLLYVIIIFFASIWGTFMFLQSVLGTNTPFKTNHNQLLSLLHAPISAINIKFIPDTEKSQQQPIDDCIQNFVSDIENLFIKKWYSNYISTDTEFLLESSKLIDVVVRRFLQIAGQINSNKVLHGTITILLRHVKEYKKAAKRAKNEGSVETQYRYAHLGSKNDKCFQQFALQLMSKTLRHFVHWELYNSVACRCLNAILAKKVISHMVHLLSAPGFINYKILMMVDSNEKFLKYQSVSIGDVDHSKVKPNVRQEEVTRNKEVDDKNGKTDDRLKEICHIKRDTEDIGNGQTFEGSTKLNAVETKEKEVKIHESKSANKTWRHSSDLDCISLGQDILILSNIAEEDAKPNWTQLAEDFKHSKEKTTQINIPIKETKEIPKEIKDIIMLKESRDIKDAPATKSLVSASVKDTMKDLQQSTSSAMHKIEDEAAGVVEGIIDLGMAGIRKGLRLTGLQDNVLEARPKSESKDIPMSNKSRLNKLPHISSDDDDKFAFPTSFKKKRKEKEILEDDFEDIYMNPLHGLQEHKFIEVVTPSYEGDILLEKSPVEEKLSSKLETKESNDSMTSITSSDSKSSMSIPIIGVSQFINVEDSPEPEYEDNPDLATTTAKLRSLLAQKTEANTPVASPMSLIPTPQDASGSSIDELSEIDGALPSMYKSWAKTVFQNTLNTIKTALPGSAAEDIVGHLGGAQGHGVIAGSVGVGTVVSGNLIQYNGDDNWHFEEMTPQEVERDGDFMGVLGRFLSERQQFCVVDNAFEAVEAIDLNDQMDGSFILHQHDGKYEEDFDDFDTTIPITKALVDLICELIEETYPPLVKENIVKTFLLTYGAIVEEKLQDISQQLIKSIPYSVGHIPKFDSRQASMRMKIEELVNKITTALEVTLGLWLSNISIKSITRLAIESLQSQKINMDTNLQILELLVSEVITSCNQSSPAFSV